MLGAVLLTHAEEDGMELPRTMKAVRFHEHGGFDVLRYEGAPVPEIGPSDALIKVQACALNRLDLWIRGGVRGRLEKR